MASMATTRGATWPRRVSVDMTDKIVKMFLWARHDIHTALLAVLWTWSTGLGLAAASGHESAAIRWAWVSGDPAGIESEAGRRALSQRRAGGHWVRGGPVADISRDRRAWGLAASGLAALTAIPPNSHAVMTQARAGWRAATSLPRDKQTETK